MDCEETDQKTWAFIAFQMTSMNLTLNGAGAHLQKVLFGRGHNIETQHCTEVPMAFHEDCAHLCPLYAFNYLIWVYWRSAV